jgi:hypothetical protein
LGKFHGEAASAEITPEVLAKQHLNVWLVIHYENKERHALPPYQGRCLSPRLRELE